MRSVSPALLDAVRNAYTLTPRMLLIDEDDVAFDEVSGEDGYLLTAQVTKDRTRLPRAMISGMTIANPTGIWTPKALAGKLWVNKRFQLDVGIVLADGSTEYVTLGRFVVDRPRVDFPDSTLDLQASDYWKLGTKRKLRQTLTLDKGLRLEQVVAILAPYAGFRTDRMRLNDDDLQLTATIVLPYGADVLDEMVKVTSDYSLDIYADWDGWLTLRHSPRLCQGIDCRLGQAPHLGGVDEYAVPFPVVPGDDAVLLNVTKDWNDEHLYNAVQVTAEASQRPTVTAEARDLNPDSPAYNPIPGTDPDWPDGGPMGDRLLPIQYTSRLSDWYACYVLAQKYLFENCLVEETYDLTLAMQPQLEPYDLLLLDHPDSDSSGILLIDSISFSTNIEDNQNVGIKQLRWLSPPVG